MDDLLQPSTAPRPRLGEAIVEPLGENPTWAIVIAAAEPPDLEANSNSPPMRREIAQAPFVPAMDLRRCTPAQRARRRTRRRPRDGDKGVAGAFDFLDDQTIRQQGSTAISETHVRPPTLHFGFLAF
jgi:hypothetical protein